MKKKIGVRFKLISIASIILFFMIWELVTDVFEIVPSTMLPSPNAWGKVDRPKS